MRLIAIPVLRGSWARPALAGSSRFSPRPVLAGAVRSGGAGGTRSRGTRCGLARWLVRARAAFRGAACRGAARRGAGRLWVADCGCRSLGWLRCPRHRLGTRRIRPDASRLLPAVALVSVAGSGCGLLAVAGSGARAGRPSRPAGPRCPRGPDRRSRHRHCCRRAAVAAGAARPALVLAAVPAAATLAAASRSDTAPLAAALAGSGPSGKPLPNISCLKLMTTPISSRNASPATPIEIATSNRLPATTPVTSSPIATSTTERTTPNRTTLELRLRSKG